jgi:sugar phosphate isomerase/epimerase
LKIGLSTWSLLGLDVASAVRAIGDADFDYIELWGDAPHALPGWVDKRALSQALSSYEMTITMHAPFTDLNPANPFQPVRGAVERTLVEFVRFSDSLGAKIITIHPGSVHNEAMVAASAASASSILRTLVEAADGRLAISVENQTKSKSRYHYPLGSTADSLRALMETVEGLRFTLDTGHAHASAQVLDGLVQMAGPKLVEVHLSDNTGASDAHLVPGEGTATLTKLMGMLAGSDVFVCLELNPHIYSPKQVLAVAVSFKSNI